MSPVRRLDHVAIAVRDTDRAAAELSSRLGLREVHRQEVMMPPVRLTYLDAGNCFIQLIEPLSTGTEIAKWLEEHGEGVHHICFGVDDVSLSVAEIGHVESMVQLGTGRGRPSGFVPGSIHGVRVECTQFIYADDVAATDGWLKS
jgi:methylmalonyl-CoA epimerase